MSTTPSHFYEAHQWLFFNKILLYYPPLVTNPECLPTALKTAFCTQHSRLITIWFQYHFSLGSASLPMLCLSDIEPISLCVSRALCGPWTVAGQGPLPWDCQGRILGGCHALLRIFSSPGTEPVSHLHRQAVLYHSSHLGSPCFSACCSYCQKYCSL